MMSARRTREDLMAFLDYCKDKGLLKATTAESRKAAVNQVLGILKDDEAQDVSTLDLDAVLMRFQNMHGARYTPDSLKTYRNRVRNSISDFLEYQQNPMDFRPRVTPALRRVKGTGLPTRTKATTKADNASAAPAQQAPNASFMSSATLPIPLRADLTVLVHGLPFDLSENEAKKIANVIMAMALPTSAS